MSSLIVLSVMQFLFHTARVTWRPNRMNNLDPFALSFLGNSSVHVSMHDVLLVVRTSAATKDQRLPPILQTWFRFSPLTTYFTSNTDIRPLIPSYHHQQIYQTECPNHHSIRDLCCQSASDFHIYFAHEEEFQWLCRFDDDQYVNVPRLIDYLRHFQPDTQPLYIGKPSLKQPKVKKQFQYWFGTYGAGVCFSRSLLRLIRAEIETEGRFMLGCVHAHTPDDSYIAYLLHTKFNINLTVAEHFHHHLELDLFSEQLDASNIDQAITLGFKGSVVPPFVPIFEGDTFHMRTLHCLLYPDNDCLRRLRILASRFYTERENQTRAPATEHR